MLSLQHPVSAVRKVAVEYVKEILTSGQVCAELVLQVTLNVITKCYYFYMMQYY